ncbi:phage major capsid protein [Faecalicatena contorta]|uniref:phage major capsid protein n=1 Tax=Faecalicatena contorta TaxID=39482 RepID=UPI00129EEB19|nr:phage major capsid protein [Faecalicatena contorta]MRM91183.1 phage major capsid protein [Faecalicatena contorta]
MNRNGKLMKKMNLQKYAASDMIDRTGAEALISEQVANEIIQGVAEQSAVLRMGRKLANMSKKKYRMPVLDMLPVAYWVTGDTGFKQTSKIAWKNKFITAEELAVIIPIPEAVLDDADYDIWGEVKPRAVEALGRKIDGAILFNEEKPDTWRDGLVKGATDAENVVTLGTSDDLYDKIMGEDGVIAKVEESGFFPSGHMGDVTMRAKLRGLKDSTGQPIFKSDMQGATTYALDGSPMDFPRNGAFDKTQALMITGDFEQLVYSIRQDVTYKLLTEATIVDPSTKEVIYALAQQDMVALRIVMRLGWEIPNPINAMKETEADRFPFAILKAGA